MKFPSFCSWAYTMRRADNGLDVPHLSGRRHITLTGTGGAARPSGGDCGAPDYAALVAGISGQLPRHHPAALLYAGRFNYTTSRHWLVSGYEAEEAGGLEQGHLVRPLAAMFGLRGEEHYLSMAQLWARDLKAKLGGGKCPQIISETKRCGKTNEAALESSRRDALYPQMIKCEIHEMHFNTLQGGKKYMSSFP